MIILTVASPIPLLVFVNAKSGLAGHGFEPFMDNMIAYSLLLPIFAASAISTGLYYALRPRRSNVLTYALAGAVGSTALMTVADKSDNYFTVPGVGWIWPLSGFALGFVFGGVFRTVHNLQLKSRS